MVIPDSDWELLLDVVRQMAETRQLEPLLTYATEQALVLVGAEQGYLILLNDDGSLDFRVQFSSNAAHPPDPSTQISETILRQVLNTGEPLLSANAQVDERLEGTASVQGLRIHSIMCLPLIARGRILGAMYIENRSRKGVFDHLDMRRMRYFCSQAAVSIENAILNDALETRVKMRSTHLQDANVRLRKLSRAVEQSTNAIAITDMDGRIGYVNPALLHLTGYQPNVVLEHNLNLLMPDTMSAENIAAVLNAAAHGSEWWQEVRKRKSDGTSYWVRLQLSPIKDVDGTITNFLVVMDDVTARKQAETALRASEERLELALIGGSHALWDWDIPTGEVVRNNRWAEMLGYRIDEIESTIHVMDEFCHPDDLERVKQRFTAHLDGHAPIYEAEYRVRTRSGEWMWIHDRGQVVERDEHGTPLRMTGTQHDITARKLAENTVQQSHTRMTVLQQVDFELARKLEVDYVTRIGLNAAVQLSGATAGIIGVTDENGDVRIIHATGEYIGAIGSYLSREKGIAARVIREREAVLVRDINTDPDYINMLTNTRAQMTLPLMSGERFVGILSLETNNPAQFDDDTFNFVKLVIARIAIALDNAQAYEELERTVGELDAFADTVAHDLKNPLSLITGYVSLIMSYEPGEMDDNQLRESLRRVESNALKMSDIIDALLLLAGVRRTEHLHVAPVYMESIVGEVYERLSLMIESTGAQITMPDEWPVVVGYAPWIEQVWFNYLSNALKYGGEPPHVTLGVNIRDHSMAEFWVQDNGPGLTAEQQAKVFTPFTRLSDRKVEGHGLGLSIVQRIVTRLGGSVAVTSALNQGSTFCFTLPLAPELD